MTYTDTMNRQDYDSGAIPDDLDRLENLDDWEIADGEIDPRGYDLVGIDGGEIGTIENLLASPTTQRAHFAIVETGGWFSGKRFLIPLESIDFRDGRAYTHLTKERFQGAPEWHEGDRDYERYYSYWMDPAEKGPAAETHETTHEYRVPVTQEEVVVNKRLREAGQITLRKRVETETRHVSAPVMKTHVTVETREAPAGETLGANVAELRPGETLRVPILEEELEVNKVQQGNQEVVIRATAQRENVERDVELRREVVEVDEEGEVDVERTPHEAGQA